MTYRITFIVIFWLYLPSKSVMQNLPLVIFYKVFPKYLTKMWKILYFATLTLVCFKEALENSAIHFISRFYSNDRSFFFKNIQVFTAYFLDAKLFSLKTSNKYKRIILFIVFLNKQEL